MDLDHLQRRLNYTFENHRMLEQALTHRSMGVHNNERLEFLGDAILGFEIAEADLKLRGPGDLEGTQQSGIPFDLKIANLGKDSRILQYARDQALEILEEDPGLEQTRHEVLVRQLKRLSEGRFDWSQIS